jgi:hypothetical protein
VGLVLPAGHQWPFAQRPLHAAPVRVATGAAALPKVPGGQSNFTPPWQKLPGSHGRCAVRAVALAPPTV